jgi:hypothetical protein
MSDRKFKPGQRVRVNENAVGLVAGLVDLIGHVGIVSENSTSLYDGDYLVKVRTGRGSSVILRLPGECLDETSWEFHL